MARATGRRRTSRRQGPGDAAGTQSLESSAPASLRNSRRGLAPAIVVGLLAFLTAATGLGNAFVGDDYALIITSERLHGFAHWKEVLTSPYWPPPFIPDLYRPVASLILALQYALGSGAPSTFRLGSCLLYAAACIGVLRLATRLSPPLIALAVGVLFAVHPVHVEAVALAVSQSELIVAFVATFGTAFYLHRRRQSSGTLTLRDWGALAGLYLVACLSKEDGFMLPGLLLAAECVVVDTRPFTERVRKLWTGYAGLIAVGVAALVLRTMVLGGALNTPGTADGLPNAPFATRLLTMLQIAPQWFRLLLWPAHLRSDYGAQEFVASHSFGAAEAAGLTLLSATIVTAWMLRRRAPVVTFGVLWCAVALLPVSNLMASSAILLAERTLFLPSVGAVIALGGAMALLVERLAHLKFPRRVLVPAAVTLLAMAGIARSVKRMAVWRDLETLMVAGVVDAPRSWRLQEGYGEVYFDLHRLDESIPAFYRAIDLAPVKWETRNALADRLIRMHRDSEAVIQLRHSLEENPDQVGPAMKLPPALIAMGHYAEARALLDRVTAGTDAPPMLLYLRHVVDSALAVHAPPGSVHIGVEQP